MYTSPKKATHQQTRAYNSQLVLKTIFDRGQISRAEVARLTGLTRTTVSELVNDLLTTGLIEESGRGPSVGGKSPIMLRMVDDARHVIGIDLAATAFRGAIVNLRGEVLHALDLPIQGSGGEHALKLVYEMIDALVAAPHQPLLGIGIGAPGLIDTPNGIVRQAVNLDWQNLPLGSLLQARYQLPVYLANDSQVAALAEYTFGGRLNGDNIVAIKAGRGVGAGIVLKGQLFQGDGYGAGEIGHVVIVDNGEACRCGNVGCVETVANSLAVVRRAQKLAAELPQSRLHQLPPDEVTLEAVLEAFHSGDEAACQSVQEAGRYLGVAVANLIGALNIHHIVLAGSLTRFGQPWLDAIQKETLKRAFAPLAQDTQIEISELDPDEVILGASALLITRELGLNLAR